MPRDHEYPSGHKTPREKQQKVLLALSSAGGYGMTSREMAKIETPGDVSAVTAWGSCFTVLHQEKLIVALKETREDHHVYVTPDNVAGRPTWPGYRHKGTKIIVRSVVIIKHCKTCTCEEH